MKKDILKAMEVEQIYLRHKLKGEQVSPLVNEIQTCGYETLDEYFDDKKQYLFNQLDFEIQEISPSQALYEWNRILRDKVTSAFILKPKNIVVWVNSSKPYNKDYCIENNLEVYELQSGGGTIVSNSGDLQLAICVPDNLWIDDAFILKSILKILSKHENDIQAIDNDILVNGGKVFGMTSVRQNGMTLFVMHFSFTDNSNLIDLICHTNSKPVKTPSCFTELNLETLENEVMSWLISI